MLELITVGKGKKLHIPVGQMPLCESHRHPTEVKDLRKKVGFANGEGATCGNCLKVAERIQQYI